MARRRIFGLLALGMSLASSAHAQYAVDWWTVDGGGATGSAGGAYRLDGTAGQPDAGGPFVGGTYALHSGFWSIAAGGLGSVADLAIGKSDGQASAVPGTLVTYTLVASNNGPDPVTAATVSDIPPATLGGVSWTCVATGGSACPAAGTGGIAASVDLVVGGTATFTLTGTVDPAATGTLTNAASIAPPAGVLDPLSVNNAAADIDTLTPRADLALAKSDAPDPVAQGGTLVYTLVVTNAGPSRSPSAIVSDVLPAQVAFVSSSPGAPACGHAAGLFSCLLGPLDPGGTASVTVTVTAGPSATALSNTATVAGGAADPVPANDSDTEPTSVIARSGGELGHGTMRRDDLAALPGGVADEDRYRIHQQPYASYEVVVDETSGDLGVGSGPLVERLGADGTTVVQVAQPAGAGPSRSLRWENPTSSAVTGEVVRVRSASCTTGCGADDVYRVRAYETTYTVPRFNNAGSQVTVLLLQNPGVTAVAGHAYFWSASGALLGTATLALGPHQLAVVNTSAVPGAAGQSGTITVTHDGRYGDLVGKTVALEPATGFSFDSPLGQKPR